MNKFIGVLLILVLAASCKNETEPIVKITTEYGDIKIRLYDKTPKHRDNFLKLVEQKFYDGLLFHRVINHFMIQGGDPTSKNAGPDVLLGEGDVDYRIDAEFVPEYFHKKGVLAAAREGDDTNPERKSSGAQFYIVQGNVYSPEQLENTVKSINERRKMALYGRLKNQYKNEFARLQEANDSEALDELSEKLTRECDSLFVNEELVLTEAQKQAYTTVGGTPHLDGQYTVYGEVIEGLDVLDKIAAVKTNSFDRPVENVVIEKINIVTGIYRLNSRYLFYLIQFVQCFKWGQAVDVQPGYFIPNL